MSVVSLVISRTLARPVTPSILNQPEHIPCVAPLSNLHQCASLSTINPDGAKNSAQFSNHQKDDQTQGNDGIHPDQDRCRTRPTVSSFELYGR